MKHVHMGTFFGTEGFMRATVAGRVITLVGADAPADDSMSLGCADASEARELAAAINVVYERRRAARVEDLQKAGAL